MNLGNMINYIAKMRGISLDKALKDFESTEKFIKDGWKHGFNFPSKLSSVGKSSKLSLILEDCSEIDGYYSSVCGYSSSPSFYTEDLIDSKYVKYWRYEKE